MSIGFNADEVFEMGLEIERNGARFYRAASARFEDPRVKEVLDFLAEQEAKHIEIFRELRKALPPGGAAPRTYDPQLEAAAYLRAMADSHVFNMHKGTDELLAGAADMCAVLALALEFEKDTILFFGAMQDAVSPELGKEEIAALIAEERKHVTQVTDLMAKLCP